MLWFSQQDGSPTARHALLTSLPQTIRDKVVRDKLRGNRNKDISVILNGVANSPDCSTMVFKGTSTADQFCFVCTFVYSSCVFWFTACHDIVKYSSWWQSIKGIFTAGTYEFDESIEPCNLLKKKNFSYFPYILYIIFPLLYTFLDFFDFLIYFWFFIQKCEARFTTGASAIHQSINQSINRSMDRTESFKSFNQPINPYLTMDFYW